MQSTEQAIEEMTERGYLINSVKVATVIGCNGEQWIPLDDLLEMPIEAPVMLFGKNAEGVTEGRITFCTDFDWLRDWWKGGWQANI